MNTYRGTGLRITWTNGTGSTVTSGSVVVLAAGLAGLIGIAVIDVANGGVGELQTEGVHELTALSTDTGSIGDRIYWDATNSRLTTTASGNTLAGELVKAKTSGQTTATVKINASHPMREHAIGAFTAAAGSTTADAGLLPSGSSVYPTTAADDTKGVRIAAGDKVSGKMIYIGNDVSNKILKVYAPSGGAINGAAADAAFSSASGKGVIALCLDATANTWLAW